MNTLISSAGCVRAMLDRTRLADGLAPLLIRLYLAPVLMQAGWNKLIAFDSTVEWFGNTDWGLGLPMPEVLAFLAASSELVGGAMLVIGLAVRWISVPLMVTMLVAMFAVHWENGWLAIADSSSWLANERVMESAERLQKARDLLQQYGQYDWLTDRGSLVVLNNGIEFAATYFVMLLSVFFTGGGRFTSLDYWLEQRWQKTVGQMQDKG
jgi:uncharacterized membrane protein YphA (DoxX/SURF4 family)